VRLEAGQLVVTPLPGDVPTAAEELKWESADMYPLIEVPDLLMEVHAWTGFADRFTHIRTQEPPRSIPAMLAGVLADATNLGTRRMASASKGVIRALMEASLACWRFGLSRVEEKLGEGFDDPLHGRGHGRLCFAGLQR